MSASEGFQSVFRPSSSFLTFLASSNALLGWGRHCLLQSVDTLVSCDQLAEFPEGTSLALAALRVDIFDADSVLDKEKPDLDVDSALDEETSDFDVPQIGST